MAVAAAPLDFEAAAVMPEAAVSGKLSAAEAGALEGAGAAEGKLGVAAADLFKGSEAGRFEVVVSNPIERAVSGELEVAVAELYKDISVSAGFDSFVSGVKETELTGIAEAAAVAGILEALVGGLLEALGMLTESGMLEDASTAGRVLFEAAAVDFSRIKISLD